MTNEQYHLLVQPYNGAMNLILARLKVLDHNVYEKNEYRSIHSVTSRIQEKDSIEKSRTATEAIT